jgi:hypothetical protein
LLARIARIIVSVGISILPLLYFAGYLSFIPGLPSPASLFGGGLGGTTSGTGGSSTSPFSSLFGVGTGLGSLTPFGAFGASGLIIFTILSRVGSSVSSAVNRPSMPKFKSMPGFANAMPMFGGGGQFGGDIPESLPLDITKSQYIILRMFRSGQKKTGDIAKSLSMEKRDVEGGIITLRNNGYLSSNNKLTTKGLNVLS